jgi:hypothetical protein
MAWRKGGEAADSVVVGVDVWESIGVAVGVAVVVQERRVCCAVQGTFTKAHWGAGGVMGLPRVLRGRQGRGVRVGRGVRPDPRRMDECWVHDGVRRGRGMAVAAVPGPVADMWVAVGAAVAGSVDVTMAFNSRRGV